MYETVGRLLALEAGEDASRAPRVRVRTSTGEWAVIEADRLDEAHVVVTIRAASPAELLDLLSRVHALSPRERQLVELVAAGLDTQEIAQRRHISRNTVRDHLKSVFIKMGMHSRRELLASLVIDPDR